MTSTYLRTKEFAMGFINPTIECENCGNNELACLEVNHKDGGGQLEKRETGLVGMNMYHAIINGKRDTNDLNILCRCCNAKDHLERKLKRKLPITITWESST